MKILAVVTWEMDFRASPGVTDHPTLTSPGLLLKASVFVLFPDKLLLVTEFEGD